MILNDGSRPQGLWYMTIYIYIYREKPLKSQCLLVYDKRCEREGKSEEEVRTIYMGEAETARMCDASLQGILNLKSGGIYRSATDPT